MGRDFIDDLIQSLHRVVDPDVALLKEVLILSGMPMPSENLRYLSYNRHVFTERNSLIQFSAVAVINNRRAKRWRLEGLRKTLSRLVFNPRWTQNPLDLFANNLRCHSKMMSILSSAVSDYTLLGIYHVENMPVSGILEETFLVIRPVLAVPGLGSQDLQTVIDFETSNEIRKAKIFGFPFYPMS